MSKKNRTASARMQKPKSKSKPIISNESLSKLASDLLAGLHTPGLSSVEAAILRSTYPITINETDEITALGVRGIWANRSETLNWSGEIPLSEYSINQDGEPQLITKKLGNHLEYIQELAVRYLRPPTPPPPGDIIITQQPNILIPPAPPIVIRQQPNRPCTPEPMVIREIPPKQPPVVGRKVITITGKKIPPPPRKVVIERLAPLPVKPQAVVVERWLPFNQMKRKVIFRGAPPDPVVVRPRNVIVQWSPPKVVVKKEIKYLGVVRADPTDYVQKYGCSLKFSNEIPQFILDIKPPEGIVLAADCKPKQMFHDLVGQVEALNLLDDATLEKEGLAHYKPLLNRNKNRMETKALKQSVLTDSKIENKSFNKPKCIQKSKKVEQSSAEPMIERIFSMIDSEGEGNLLVDEAKKIMMKIRPRLKKYLSDAELANFIGSLDPNNSGLIRIKDFRLGFKKLLR